MILLALFFSTYLAYQNLDYLVISDYSWNSIIYRKLWFLGFHPTFGPCFINLYGSTREFEGELEVQKDKYQDLNKGLVGFCSRSSVRTIFKETYFIQVEGFAYRGSILVEILSRSGTTIPPEPQRINSSNIQRGLKQIGGTPVSYKLIGIFFSANMIHPRNKLVEFELSIG